MVLVVSCIGDRAHFSLAMEANFSYTILINAIKRGEYVECFK